MNVSIFQICYDVSQHVKVDPEFNLYDNSKYCDMYSKLNNPREYQVFLDNYSNIPQGYTGYVSWKFKKKTNMSGSEFISKIKTGGDKSDVYFVNCGPRSVTSVWQQGEKQHPGIIKLTQSIFNKLAHHDEIYNIDVSNMRHDISKTAFCNFWVGSNAFWKKFMDFTLPVHDYIQHKLTEEQQEHMYKRACKGIESTYYPFIMERMFTTLLHVDPSIKFTNIPRNKK